MCAKSLAPDSAVPVQACSDWPAPNALGVWLSPQVYDHRLTRVYIAMAWRDDNNKMWEKVGSDWAGIDNIFGHIGMI